MAQKYGSKSFEKIMIFHTNKSDLTANRVEVPVLFFLPTVTLSVFYLPSKCVFFEYKVLL